SSIRRQQLLRGLLRGGKRLTSGNPIEKDPQRHSKRKEATMNDSTIEPIIDGVWGVYIPQLFASALAPDKWGIEEEDIKVLKEGPEHEHYWETWDKVLNNASRADDEGKTWTLH